MLTPSYIIRQPYPAGSRSTNERSDPGKIYQCTQCDRGAPTELCFPEFDACAKLSDSAVTIFHTNGVQLTSTPLPPKCHPRTLHRLTYAGLHLGVECHNYSSQIVGLQENNAGTITMTLHNHHDRTVQNEIVVEGTGLNGGTQVYRVEIDHDVLLRINFHNTNLVDITPLSIINCDFISLFNLYTQNKFLLWCDTNTDNAKRLYVIDVNHDFTQDVPPYITSNSPPLSSPNGQTFVTVSNSTLKVYRTDHLNNQPPGARDFGSVILFHTYIDNGTLLLVLEGQNQTLVNITKFIDSSGTNGTAPLSSASVNATLHKAIMGGAYITYNKIGTLYNLLLYTTGGRLINTFPNFASEPDDVFFQVAPAPSRLPPPSPTTITSTFTSEMTTTSYVETISDSHSSLMPSFTPVTEATEDPGPSIVIATIVAITVGLVFLLFVVILFLFICIKNRRKSLSPRDPHPIEETHNDGSTSHTSITNLISLKTFKEPMSVSASESDLDAANVFAHPIPETSSQT